MKEYSILIRNGSGCPYFLGTYKDITSAKKAILNLVKFEEEKNNMYFVDNDFFQNKYCYASCLKYMCIKEREVSDWNNYSEENISGKINNIIYLKNITKNIDIK